MSSQVATPPSDTNNFPFNFPEDCFEQQFPIEEMLDLPRKSLSSEAPLEQQSWMWDLQPQYDPQWSLEITNKPQPQTVESPPSQSTPKSNRSDDECKAERRRAQNRAAQRAYRERQDNRLKARSLEVVALKQELAQVKKLNVALYNTICCLKAENAKS